jgi:HEAT repeat protein
LTNQIAMKYADPRITALMNELEGSLPFVRHKAAERLIEMGEAAVPALIDALHPNQPRSVQYVAVEALGRIGTPEALTAVEEWRRRYF